MQGMPCACCHIKIPRFRPLTNQVAYLRRKNPVCDVELGEIGMHDIVNLVRIDTHREADLLKRN